MSHSTPFRFVAALSGLFILAQATGAAAAPQSPPQIVDSNALLKSIYREDPERALALAVEAGQLLAAVERGAAAASEPRLHFRGTAPSAQTAPQESEILEKNRQSYDQNPILREIYTHSPLASLRMLKRLREATEKNN